MNYRENEDSMALKYMLDCQCVEKIKNRRNILFENDFFIEVLLFQIIMKSKLSKNPYDLNYIKDRYNNYMSKNINAKFSLQDLFDEKWLICILNEWHFNFTYRRIIDNSNIQDDRLNYIIGFINELSDVRYKDERKIIIDIDVLMMILNNHRNSFPKTPDFHWFENNNIIESNNGEYLLNKKSKIIQPFLDYIFAKMWSQSLVSFDSLEKKLEWWIEFFEVFGYRASGFGQFLDERKINELIKTALEWIINDNKLGDWDDEKKIAIMKKRLSNEADLEGAYLDNIFPKYYIEKITFLEQHYYSYYHYAGANPRGRVELILSLIFEYYNSINYSGFKDNINNIIMKPFVIGILLQNPNWRKSDLIIDLLDEKDTILIGCMLLLKYERLDKLSSQSYEIWNQGLKFVNTILSTMTISSSEKSKLFFDLGMYLINKGLVHLDHSKQLYLSKSNIYYAEAYNIFIATIDIGNDLPTLLPKIDERLKMVETPITSKEFLFLIDILEAIKTGSLISHTQNKAFDMLCDAYIKSIKYVGKDTHCFSLYRVSIMEKNLWGDIINYISDDNSTLLEIIGPFNNKNYIISDEQIKENSGYAFLLKKKATIHFIFILNLIKTSYNGTIRLNNKTQSIIKSFYQEYFILFQNIPELDIFDINYMELLNSRYAQKLAVECFNYVEKDIKNNIINYLKKVNPQKLIYFLPYIRDIDERNVLEEIIRKNIDNINIENIYYIPQIAEFINNIIISQNMELIPKAEKLLIEYINIIKGKGDHLYKENISWINDAQMRIALLSKNYELIMNSNQLFYKGIVYLQSDEHKNYQKAVELYEKLLINNPVHSIKQNLLCAYVRRIVELKEKNGNYLDILKNAKKIIDELQKDIISNNYEIYGKEIFYSNILFLYFHLDNKGEFWLNSNQMPDILIHSKECGLYIAGMLKREGKEEEAKKIFTALYNIYGKDQDIIDFEQNIKNNFYPSVSSEISPIKEMRYYLNLLKRSTLNDLCNVLGGATQPKQMEILLTSMVLDTCDKVNSYSPNLIYDNNVSDEDRYSILFKEFFNYRFSYFLNFSMNDQPKLGFTGTTTVQKREGLGENDLNIKYDDKVISIIEAIRLDSVVKQEIFKHINKLFGYDIHNCNIMFVLIYGTNKNPKTLWEGYCNYLENDFITDCKDLNYKAYKSCKAIDLDIFQKNNFIQNFIQNKWIYCTKHKNDDNGVDVIIIHIYIDVLKYQQQEVAKSSRK